MLHLLHTTEPQQIEVFRAEPFELDIHPLRPGMGHDEVRLNVSRELAAAIETAAAADGSPTQLWANIAIESQRALEVAAGHDEATMLVLERELDAACERIEPGPLAHRKRRLVRYARALRSQQSRQPGPRAEGVPVAVAHHTLVAWEREAAARGQRVEDWAIALLAKLPAGRQSWEAAAAESGQTLSEWIWVQAARRSSRASATPQP